jgi:TRAP transporter TAXI family solute receptor
VTARRVALCRVLAMLTCGALLASLTSLGGCSAARSEPAPAQTWRIATGETGSLIERAATALFDGLEQNVPGLAATIVATPGSQRNVEALQQGEAEAAFTMSDVTYDAYADSSRQLRGIAVVYTTTLHLVVRPEAVRSLADLEGRRLGIGTPGSGSVFTARLVLGELGAGNARMEAIPFAEAADRVVTNRLDGLMISSNFPTSSVSRALAGGARLFPIDGPAVDRLRQEYPFLHPMLIPANTYPGQPTAVRTIGIDNLLVCRADLDADLVYAFTRHFMERLPLAAQQFPSLRLVSPARAASTPIPLHPGAARYYRERELLR